MTYGNSDLTGLRVLVLARLSQEYAGQTGIDSQDTLTTAWCERHGMTVVAVVADKKSGTVAPWNRPHAKPWLTDSVKIAQYDAVAAYRFDRLSRGAKQDTNAIEQWANIHGKKLLTEDGLAFPAEGKDGIRWDITARMAHEEWLSSSERYTRMQNHLRSQGYLVGKAPFGYRIVCAEDCGYIGEGKCPHHKTLAPADNLKPVVVGMFERYRDGASMRDLADWLDSQGIRAGKWTTRSLGVVLRNTVYVGRRKNAAGKTILKVLPIVPVDLFEAVQVKLANNHGKRLPSTRDNSDAWLTSVLKCGKCQAPMYRVNTRGDYVYYRCFGSGKFQRTGHPLIPIDKMHKVADDMVMSFAYRPHKELVVVGGDTDHQDELDQIEQDLRELDFDDPEFLTKQAGLLAERTRLRSLPAPATRVEEQETGKTTGEVWLSLDPSGKRKYLLDRGVTIYAHKDDTGEVIVTADGWDLFDTLDSLETLK